MIEEIEERTQVHFKKGVNQKYVHVIAKSKSGSEYELLWGDPARFYHSDIVEVLKVLYSVTVLRVAGGGRLCLPHKKRTIYVWDFSGSYGFVNHDDFSRIVRMQYPRLRVKWTHPPGHNVAWDT